MSEETPRYGVGTMLNCRVGCIRRGAHAAPLDCDVPSERRMPAWPMTEDEPVDPGERARKTHEEALARWFEPPPRPDPTEAPSYYTATHSAGGVEAGTELLDVMAAWFGDQAVIEYLRFELMTKAMRFGRNGREVLDDVRRMEQAVAKLRGVVERETTR